MVWAKLVRGALILGLANVASMAGAQDNAEAQGADAQTPASDDSKDKEPMGWFGIGLKLGAGGVGSSEI